MESRCAVLVHLRDFLCGFVAHVDDLDTSHAIERCQPQELLLLSAREEEVLAVLSLEAEGVLPFAGDTARAIISMILH